MKNLKIAYKSYSISLLVVIASFVLSACSMDGKNQFSVIGSSILNSVGVNVSPENVDNFVNFGEQISKASRGLSEEQEYYLGRAVSASILKDYPLTASSGSIRYVNKVGKILAAYSPRPETFSGYHFGVLSSNEINALSAPGGFVYVTKGFVSKLKDEDSLAAVLAHEIAHVALGHGTAAISQANITSALAALGKDAVAYSTDASLATTLLEPFTDSVNDIVETLLRKGYSRSQEYEADLLATQILANAGYQNAAMLSVLEELSKHANESGGWTDTHPKPEKRIDELKDEVPNMVLNMDDAGYKIRKQRFAKQIGN